MNSNARNIPGDADIARLIDHTLLKPDATYDQIAQLCSEALKYHFAAVCVNSANTKRCSELLKGTNVKVCTTISFPLGAMSPEVKVFETETALKDGANEVVLFGGMEGEMAH